MSRSWAWLAPVTTVDSSPLMATAGVAALSSPRVKKNATATIAAPSTIARAIEQEDRTALSKLPGIGARSADKIIATLRGKVVAEAAMQDSGIALPVDVRALEGTRLVADVVETIVALGFSRADARSWVEAAQESSPGLVTVEALTLAVLRGRDAG